MARNDRLLNVLQGLADHLKSRLVKEVISQGKVATSKGVQSIDVTARELIDSMVITESHEDYMTFVDRGRKKGGKRVPIAAIEQWLKIKNFSWAAANIRGSAFAVQTNIFKFGIKPSRWLTKTLSETEPKIVTDITFAVNREIDITIDNMITSAIKSFT